jgi:hypothetical protein
MKHLLILISLILLSSPVIGQSEKPQTIIIPTGSIGEMSEARIRTLEKTLESKLDDHFAIVPKELFEEAQEQAFQEMDSDECTEDQCILMIKEILQIENAFKMDLISEDGDTQISITWNDQDQKRVEEDYCEGCKTKGLRLMIGGLVEKLVRNRMNDKPSILVEKKETENVPKTQTDIFSNSERMRVRFDSSFVGNHEGKFSPWDETEKSLNLMTISMIFKSNFGVGLSAINWAGTTAGSMNYEDYQNWGVSGNFLNAYYVFEEKNPNTYWIDDMPLSLTLGTSYPLSLEIKYWSGRKGESNLGSQLISIGSTVADDFEIIFNRNYYHFNYESSAIYDLTTYTLGIGYFF